MSTSRERRTLGMDRAITRRDFINGVAVGAAATWAGLHAAPVWAQDPGPPFAPEHAADYYPPALTGLRGSHAGSFEAGHALRDGAYADFPRIDVDTGETYDLVVVGGGISGLSAAYFFRKNLGNDRTVLLLDNHDDFGGHAKRNEFTHEGRTYISYGGTQGISTPFPFSHAAKSLIRELGLEVERYSEFVDRDILAGLTRAVFFDAKPSASIGSWLGRVIFRGKSSSPGPHFHWKRVPISSGFIPKPRTTWPGSAPLKNARAWPK